MRSPRGGNPKPQTANNKRLSTTTKPEFGGSPRGLQSQKTCRNPEKENCFKKDEKTDIPIAKVEFTNATNFTAEELTLYHAPESSKSAATKNALIVQYVDFTSKYGLGYKLSNGAYGVLFNDSTKIILDPNHFHFDYVHRVKEAGEDGYEDRVTQYNYFDYPSSLNKKVILLQHFKSYLDGNEKFKPLEFNFTKENAPLKPSCTEKLPYLKKWRRAKKAILFRLSNKIIQVLFQDQSELILCSGSGMVTFVTSKKVVKKLPLSTDLETRDPSMYKRLQYSKEILVQMINKGSTAQTQTHREKLREDNEGLAEVVETKALIEQACMFSSRRPAEQPQKNLHQYMTQSALSTRVGLAISSGPSPGSVNLLNTMKPTTPTGTAGNDLLSCKAIKSQQSKR